MSQKNRLDTRSNILFPNPLFSALQPPSLPPCPGSLCCLSESGMWRLLNRASLLPQSRATAHTYFSGTGEATSRSYNLACQGKRTIPRYPNILWRNNCKRRWEKGLKISKAGVREAEYTYIEEGRKENASLELMWGEEASRFDGAGCYLQGL